MKCNGFDVGFWRVREALHDIEWCAIAAVFEIEEAWSSRIRGEVQRASMPGARTGQVAFGEGFANGPVKSPVVRLTDGGTVMDVPAAAAALCIFVTDRAQ